MKIFHLGDLHIGKLVNGFSMIDDQRFVLNQLYSNIDIEKPDIIIIAGDIFDRSIPNIDAVELADEMFIKIAIDRQIPLIAIAGNHDGKERIDYLSKFAEKNNLYLRGIVEKEIKPIFFKGETKDIAIYPIPYAKPALIRELFEDESIKDHDDSMHKIIREIEKKLDRNKINIAIAHGHVSTINADGVSELEESKSEKPLEIGGTDVIDASYFDVFDYTALGHLHAPQKVKSNKIRYSGSLLKYSFSEVNQKKGITVVELDKDGGVSTQIIEFKPRRNMRIIRGELNDILNQDISCEESNQDYIRVELEDDLALIDPISKIRGIYPNIMELGRAVNKDDNNIERKKTASNIKDKTSLTLFQEFYLEVTGKECETNKLDIMKKIIGEVESEVEGNAN